MIMNFIQELFTFVCLNLSWKLILICKQFLPKILIHQITEKYERLIV
jgi:hypothetical protein